jgi:hypothetical protein
MKMGVKKREDDIKVMSNLDLTSSYVGDLSVKESIEINKKFMLDPEILN